MKKILVIEDEEQIRDNIQEILELEEFETIAASNGLVGIQLANSQNPDLIVCDVMMPELDGYEVLTALRRNVATATIPLIFLTAKADKSDLRQGMELGADDYLTKPFTPAELLSAIFTRLEKQTAIVQQSETKLEKLRSSITLSLPHEIHTPLHGILGLSDLLKSEANSIHPDEIIEIASDIYTSGKKLYELVQKFMLYAQLEVTATDPEQVQMLRRERTHSTKSAIEEVALQKAKQQHREASLHLEIQNAIVQISEFNLKKIAEELIDNAFKYSPVGTPIHIIGIQSSNVFLMSVIDYGRGMTAEQITNVGAYTQFERKLYEQQGSGLGLIIAKRLAELHGGELTIKSLPGEQTIVRVALPLS